MQVAVSSGEGGSTQGGRNEICRTHGTAETVYSPRKGCLSGSQDMEGLRAKEALLTGEDLPLDFV